MVTELSIIAMRNPADCEWGEGSNSAGKFKGLWTEPKSARLWHKGTGRQAGRGEVLTEMCSLGPGRGNLSQVSAWRFQVLVSAFQKVSLQFEVHRRGGRMVRALGILPYEERLTELFGLEENLHCMTFQLFLSLPCYLVFFAAAQEDSTSLLFNYSSWENSKLFPSMNYLHSWENRFLSNISGILPFAHRGECCRDLSWQVCWTSS